MRVWQASHVTLLTWLATDPSLVTSLSSLEGPASHQGLDQIQTIQTLQASKTSFRGLACHACWLR